MLTGISEPRAARGSQFGKLWPIG